MKSSDVVCCTLAGAADKVLANYIKVKMKGDLFDIGVIDECAQSVEP